MSVNCSACADLRETSPDFVTNGVTDAVCTSLQNNTGLNSTLSVLHTDGDDLHLVNDCLIGNMTGEVETYEVCDWQTFMKKLLPNIWSTIKAIICAIAGLWSRVESIEDQISGISSFGNVQKIYSEWGYREFSNSNKAALYTEAQINAILGVSDSSGENTHIFVSDGNIRYEYGTWYYYIDETITGKHYYDCFIIRS